MSNKNPVLLYLHIPKTAGVSIRSLLASHYAEDEIVNVNGPDYLGSEQRLFELDETQRQRIGLVCGHFSFGVHAAFDRPSVYATIMRDPVDRLASLYYYARTTPKHARHDRVSRMSLIEFALSGMHPEIENCQTKMLSGRPECNFMAGTQPCSDQDFEMAKAHLAERFPLLGIYEQMELSSYLICSEMGWTYRKARRKNVTTSRKVVTDLHADEIAAIRSVNQYDIALYEYAEERFRNKVKSLSMVDRLRFTYRQAVG